MAQAESLRYKLLGGLAARRACYGVVRFIMENGAKGCEVIISGKLRAQRAKAMKFKDGYMLKSGNATLHYIDSAVRHINLKQGVLGISVQIMLPYDPTGRNGCAVMQPDVVEVRAPKPEPKLNVPAKQGYAENFAPEPQQPQAAPAAVPQETAPQAY